MADLHGLVWLKGGTCTDRPAYGAAPAWSVPIYSPSAVLANKSDLVNIIKYLSKI